MILANAQLIFPDRVARGDIKIRRGKIEQISEATIVPDAGETKIDLDGKFLAPGFIDLHVHGALRCDAMEADESAFRTICKYHAAGGTTSLALTTVTATTEEILRVIDAVEQFRKQP